MDGCRCVEPLCKASWLELMLVSCGAFGEGLEDWEEEPISATVKLGARRKLQTGSSGRTVPRGLGGAGARF